MRITPPDARRLLTNSGIALAGRVAGILLSLGLAIGLYRLLGPDAYGAWSLLAAVLTSTAVLDLGLAGAVEREVAASMAVGAPTRAAAAVTSALGIVAVVSLVAELLVLAWPVAPAGAFGAAVWEGVRVLPVAFGIGLAALVAGAGLTGVERFAAHHVWRTGGLAVGTALTLALAASGVQRLDGLVLAYASGTALAGVGSVVALHRTWPSWRAWRGFDAAPFADILHLGLALQAASVGPLLADFALRWMLGTRFGAAAAGVYDLAGRAAIVPRSLGGALLSAVVPVSVRLYQTSRDEFAALHDRVSAAAAAVMLPATLAAMLVTPLVAAWLVTPEARPVFAWTMAGLLACHGLVTLWVPRLLMARGARLVWPEALGATLAAVAALALAAVAPSMPVAAVGFWLAHLVGLALAGAVVARRLGLHALPMAWRRGSSALRRGRTRSSPTL